VCFLLSLSFSFPSSLPPSSVFLYLYSSLSHSISLFLASYHPLYPSLSHLSLTPLLHPYSSVSVLAVKTKTIPVWDEALAARVRDGMTLQGTYVHTTTTTHALCCTPLYKQYLHYTCVCKHFKLTLMFFLPFPSATISLRIPMHIGFFHYYYHNYQ
jgi:hypothetical protein